MHKTLAKLDEGAADKDNVKPKNNLNSIMANMSKLKSKSKKDE